MSHVQTPVRRPRPEWIKSVRAALIASVVVSVILLAFAWPTVTSKVQDLPVAVVGSQQQIDSLEDKMPDDNLLELHPVANRQDAENGIRSREVYGAILMGDQPEILTASAGSPVASQMLTSMGTTMQRGIDQQVIAKQTEALQQMKSAMAQGPSGMAAMAQQSQQGGQQQSATPPTVKITDVVPLSGDDPRGAGLAIAGLPLTMGGMIGGVLISLLVTGPRKHLLAIALYGIIGGLALAGLMQGLFHILQGSFFANAAAIGVGIAATASVIVGLNALIGRPGIGVGAVITMFIGNPLSSLTQPKEFILAPFGEIGQWLVPGLSGTVLRDLSYFPDANIAGQIWALIGWLTAGVVLVLVGHYRNQAAIPSHERGGDADGARTAGSSSTAGAHHAVTSGEGTRHAASDADPGTHGAAHA